MAGTRPVGRSSVIVFDQATTSNVIIHSNRYQETITTESQAIAKLCEEIKDSEIMNSKVGDVVLDAIGSIKTGCADLVEKASKMTDLLNKKIQTMEDIENQGAAKAGATGVKEAASKISKKQ